ncbi:MAG: LysM peptidoglycan-binding domain-containing protein [Bacteroidales bacterium]|jgi:LysM repeat protein|nr:glucosaminidase domain-containing protein [Bacteroidales bacterium]MDY0315749.1 glucosaminidase domain-containing protein [Bacteroidales bacterium]NLB85614.1 LysM peptidoglycan-binding domain-containing protein [Bacteroidales bacterium]
MRILVVIFFLFTSSIIYSQITPEQYINIYSDLAIKEMKRVGVPASITLSQGMLESGNGNSYLATKGNNHFGIKCHKWTGEKIYADDDAKNECFRKYKNVEQSFIDHSDFLKENSRYHFLFDLDITDYKAWAKGLKQAGYATNPNYANSLINIIERHELFNFDLGIIKPIAEEKPTKRPSKIKTSVEDNFIVNPYSNSYNYNNDVPYIIVVDTVEIGDLAKQLDLMRWQLVKYNDLNKNSILYPSNIIYVKPKRNKAQKQYKIHVVEHNESVRDISEKYAVKSKKILKFNDLNDIDQALKIGSKIKLRR